MTLVPTVSSEASSKGLLVPFGLESIASIPIAADENVFAGDASIGLTKIPRKIIQRAKGMTAITGLLLFIRWVKSSKQTIRAFEVGERLGRFWAHALHRL